MSGGELGCHHNESAISYFERILRERDRAEAEREKRLDERFESQEKALVFALTEREKGVTAALTAAKEAVEKAEAANEKRFESANEWRGQSADRERTQQEQMANFSATLLPRETFENFVKTYDTAHKKIEEVQSKMLGAVAIISLAVPVITGLVIYFVTK